MVKYRYAIFQLRRLDGGVYLTFVGHAMNLYRHLEG